jgi:hypothetical protein
MNDLIDLILMYVEAALDRSFHIKNLGPGALSVIFGLIVGALALLFSAVVWNLPIGLVVGFASFIFAYVLSFLFLRG